jgi:formate dehydrogenase iron-sulfur subunit
MATGTGEAGVSTNTTAFLTDSTLCIGCEACEVACKEWNQLPDDGFEWSGNSYDNTGALGHSTWRHVKFVEGTPEAGIGGNSGEQLPAWSFSSDVCKHCEVAGCLDACPTGAIVRMEFGAVYIQPDVCNGCSYCVVSCPFGVVQRNVDDGRAFKCTFCSDRQRAGLQPACAKACPTESIKFGKLDELTAEAESRLQALKARGIHDAVIYNPTETSVGGIHSLFLLRGDPSSFNLPPQPEAPVIYMKKGWTSAAIAASSMLALALISFMGARR